MSPKVYVVIVNWNGWRDTIECLESVLRSDYGDYQVVVCDNGSADGSLEHIAAWAAGRETASVAAEAVVGRLTTPPLGKPVAFTRLTRAAAQRGGDPSDQRLTLVENGANLGFAGGNNVGLRYALARGDCAYAWLLNNDTVVEAGALRALVARCAEDAAIGMVGSTLRYYHRPDRIQARGGARYRPWLAAAQHLGVGDPAAAAEDPRAVERAMSYVVGASMLLSGELLHRVGLLNEDYFLYFEELDLAVRARPRYRCGFAPASIVYHKEGASMGSSSEPGRARSALADYHLLRNRVVVSWRYFPWALPAVYAGLVVAAFNRIRRGQWRRVGSVFRAGLGTLSRWVTV